MFHGLTIPSENFEVCVSTDCVWMVILRTIFGFGCLLFTHRFANKFFRAVLPPLGCFAPRLVYNNACIIKVSACIHHGAPRFYNGIVFSFFSEIAALTTSQRSCDTTR
jgi:hypothetical protein